MSVSLEPCPQQVLPNMRESSIHKHKNSDVTFSSFCLCPCPAGVAKQTLQSTPAGGGSDIHLLSGACTRRFWGMRGLFSHGTRTARCMASNTVCWWPNKSAGVQAAYAPRPVYALTIHGALRNFILQIEGGRGLEGLSPFPSPAPLANYVHCSMGPEERHHQPCQGGQAQYVDH